MALQLPLPSCAILKELFSDFFSSPDERNNCISVAERTIGIITTHVGCLWLVGMLETMEKGNITCHGRLCCSGHSFIF